MHCQQLEVTQPYTIAKLKDTFLYRFTKFFECDKPPSRKEQQQKKQNWSQQYELAIKIFCRIMYTALGNKIAFIDLF